VSKRIAPPRQRKPEHSPHSRGQRDARAGPKRKKRYMRSGFSARARLLGPASSQNRAPKSSEPGRTPREYLPTRMTGQVGNEKENFPSDDSVLYSSHGYPVPLLARHQNFSQQDSAAKRENRLPEHPYHIGTVCYSPADRIRQNWICGQNRHQKRRTRRRLEIYGRYRSVTLQITPRPGRQTSSRHLRW
jgi:hypothetical protein